ncbi:uncharacterized protein IL334_005304 [Kwoniella shivajii]|uniref:Mitochondrial intermembrane space import and assembly protein 40 n=1 Tax=Kwoniella shivajii TaxID=564305 RepID=A0ABZ1D2Z4_9TREE|nr:hypothetical protein IL334_005304 [Kwoniella shivajii]
MFTRPAVRSLRSISRRTLSTQSSSSSSSSSAFNRNAVIAATTLVVAGLTITSERRKVYNDDRVRESVLDQSSLKAPIHKREGEARSLEAGKSTAEKLKSTAQQVKTQTHEAESQFESKANDVKEKVSNRVDQAKEIYDDKVDQLEDAAKTASSSAKEHVHRLEGVTPEEADQAAQVVEGKSIEATQPSQGAFNEETGEINWDCPCLGGMADGPCGEQFKEAFSCFIYSEAEPKGVDCVEKFKHMQDCFRAHPEIYGEEIDDDENELDQSDLGEIPNPADQGVSIKEETTVPS